MERRERDVAVAERQREQNPVQRIRRAGLHLPDERLPAPQIGIPGGKAAGVKFPDANISGKTLAARLVGLGVPGNKGAFLTGTMLDHLVTHGIHESTMAAIDAKFGAKLDANYHKISNQAFYDLAQALGAKTVKLAAFH